MENSTLVSVVMLTYNDEEFVIRTLENVKAQTYQNIELVISDDYSLDNTVKICKEWVAENANRFTDVKIITTPVNTGVTANCIRAVNACNGEWLKNVGGDNLMPLDAIERFMKYVHNNPNAKMVQCQVQEMDADDNVIGIRKRGFDDVFHDDRTTAEQQYSLFQWIDPVEALGMFKNVSVLKSAEFYDTEFRNQEDTPFAQRVLKAGYKIWYIDEPLMKRRMRQGSLSGLSDDKIVPRNMIVRLDIDNKYVVENLNNIGKLLFQYRAFVVKLFYVSFLNNRNRFNSFAWKVLNYPINYYVKRHIKLAKQDIVNSWI